MMRNTLQSLFGAALLALTATQVSAVVAISRN